MGVSGRKKVEGCRGFSFRVSVELLVCTDEQCDGEQSTLCKER